MGTDPRLTAQTRNRYGRIAKVYDLMEEPIERLFYGSWRKRVWAGVKGPQVLEVGVGTGKNMPYYPDGVHVTAIDLSERMLSRARERAKRLGLDVDLRRMDAQELAFPSDTFDTIVASFVFCSVRDPVVGLRELGRVCKPERDQAPGTREGQERTRGRVDGRNKSSGGEGGRSQHQPAYHR